MRGPTMLRHMTDWHTPGEPEPAIDPTARLQQIREAFVDDVLRGLFCLAMVILPISVWRNALGPQGLRLPAALFMLSTTTAVLGVTWLSRKRLSYSTKAGALLLVLFFTGAGGLISFGQAAPTGNYFAMGFFISAILYSPSVVFWMIACAVLLMSGVGYLVVSGAHSVPVDLNAVVHDPTAWVNLTLTLSLSAGTIATAMSAFTRALQGLLGDVHRQQSEIKAQRDQIRHLATHDNLTGLPVMRLALARSRHAIAQARQSGRKIAFMFLDLDGFKGVNDRHGHDAGDHVLKEVALRLSAAVRAADTAARIGGDEFVVVLHDLLHAHAAGDVADKILHALSAPIDYDGHTLRVGASIGIAIFPDHAEDFDGLKRVADKAMYAVKASGKNNYLFAPEPPAAG